MPLLHSRSSCSAPTRQHFVTGFAGISPEPPRTNHRFLSGVRGLKEETLSSGCSTGEGEGTELLTKFTLAHGLQLRNEQRNTIKKRR